ncbi:uncharacterized protein LOC114545227 [Dendronephthya gigantea]|uniref:uncharacterized protein LOC114545227 n=1 Tax=Dendronephthya gigantea TaxID=151771 RepID=UPI00106D1260|nr:uncharacterized protein LOC114545227 [Dendronephthya gigantea]
MLKLLFSIAIFVRIAVEESNASGTCRNANWWHSFDRTGWSKCPANVPYIRGLYRNKASRPNHDWIYLLEAASCCDGGKPNAECVQANWVHSFDRHNNWNLCPSGYYLSGLYRSHGHNLHNIEHAWCCKPRGAPNSYKSCYHENVWTRFDWNKKGMISCSRKGHFITGLYRSTCNFMYCIELFKCCQLHEGDDIATCSATGDPHYRTFDGRLIHFQGICQYVLAKDIHNRFVVLGKNENCGHGVTCTKEVTVKVNNLVIVIARGGTVTVFGVKANLPYNHRGVTIARHGRNVIVDTNIGLKVDYDCVYNVFIKVTSTSKLSYRGKTRGICGSNSDNPNELRKPDNSLTTNDQDFANSWSVDRSCPNAPPPTNPCKTAGHQIAEQARKKCELLKRFPFSACHHKVNVHSGFVQDCEYDVCACKEHPSACACEEYAAYATTCGFAGVNIKWEHLPQFHHCKSPCASAPCLNGGTCRNVGRSYQCNCPSGYKGSRCERKTCRNSKALGMESGKIPDSRITASSEWDSNHGASNARLNFAKNSGSWSSRYNNQNQWLQVDFKYRATITEIWTQGRGRHRQWVRSYTVSFSNNGLNFKTYGGGRQGKVFNSNNDERSIVKNAIHHVIVARFIRIHPISWHHHISMRVEFIGCFIGQPCAREPCRNEGKCAHVGGRAVCSCLPGYRGNRCGQRDCRHAKRLGVENGKVLDSQLSASSEWNFNHGVLNGRLNFKAHGHRQGAWSSRHNNHHQWFQVNFGLQATVTEILTQGRSNYNQWVKSYFVSYSKYGLDFITYRVNGLVKVFNGNNNRNTIVRQIVSPVIVTQYIRIHPKSWHGHISMRVDFAGCQKEWPCKRRPCRNGGTCLDYGAGYRCACAQGWACRNCQCDVGKCIPRHQEE